MAKSAERNGKMRGAGSLPFGGEKYREGENGETGFVGEKMYGLMSPQALNNFALTSFNWL